MKPIALITILSMLSLSALADTYLCIGERATTISTIESEIVDAEANTTEAKWIVDENGLRNFGERRSWNIPMPPSSTAWVRRTSS